MNNSNKTLFDAIGNTPMVRLKALNDNPAVEIYAKLEGNNPRLH